MKDKKLREALFDAKIIHPDLTGMFYTTRVALSGGGQYYDDKTQITVAIANLRTLQSQFTALMDYFELEVKDVAQHMEVVEKTDE